MAIPKGNVVGGAASGGNFPGFDYAQRVVLAWGGALTALGESYNQAWSDIKQGDYGLKKYIGNLANAYEVSFGVALEVLKGPNFKSRPEWLQIEYNKTTDNPNTLSGIAKLDKNYNQSVVLVDTDYERLSGSSKAVGKICTSSWAIKSRFDTIRLDLDRTRVRALLNGYYIGFVIAQGITAEPPLAIVMLRVTS
jgi:hypothetical protein